MNFIKRTLRGIGTPFFHLRAKKPPLTEETVVNLAQLPATFENYRIAVVADTHFPDSLCTPAQILSAVRDAAPDCIFLAGDLTNRYNTHLDTTETVDFLQRLQTIAPCYAVTGNHEYKPARRAIYASLLSAADLPLIEDTFVSLEKGGDSLMVYGMCDREQTLPSPVPPCAILLTHYPHLAVKAADSGFALAVCGHAHGGQVRFSKRGLFAPGQSFFPKYISGAYTVGKLQMVVSRGLGDSSLPIRLNNPPHLPVIILKK